MGENSEGMDIEYINYSNYFGFRNIINEMDSNFGIIIYFGRYTRLKNARNDWENERDAIGDAQIAGYMNEQDPALRLFYKSESMVERIEDNLRRQRGIFLHQGYEYSAMTSSFRRLGDASGLVWLAEKNLETLCGFLLDADRLEITDVARVSYDISSKPPATIEWE